MTGVPIFPLPKSTLFNNDFNSVLHPKDHAVRGRIYISKKENLRSCTAPLIFHSLKFPISLGCLWRMSRG